MSKFGWFVGPACIVFALAAPARANLMKDVCAKRAENYSGYKPRGLTIGDHRGRLRLSGSVSIGVSTSTGGNTDTKPSNSSESAEDRKQDAKVDLYWRVFDDCMKAQ
ncbi:hypothetical protein FEE96_20570 [Parasedimentitalea maritima]|uniref:Uncharacterized protein n=1 Tax=Parasedimentitalea maritima TaxID=2578117 RepID=A0A5R8YTM3_9RHOB|nr:hypothetical protein [Zongyanglinia marina]KAE9631801.1 hypothetical protein GP644_05730 [Zongyanglinia marina]TLP56832.1 hypothetical protein FEE96_20570 [Zongyanglinia marina]